MVSPNDDPIAQDQQALDGEQGVGQADGYVTTTQWEEAKQLIAQQSSQIGQLTRELKGAHSKMDSAFDAIRRDYKQELQEARQQREQERLLETVPEDMRDWATSFMASQQTPPATTLATSGQQTQTDGSANEWQEVFDFVQRLGFNPATVPAETYNLLTDASISPEDAQANFMGALYKHPPQQQTKTPPTRPQAQPQQTQQPRTQSPPINGQPGARTVSGYDDILDAVVSRQLTRERANELLAAGGHPLLR